jgi:hypothetical protein
VKLPSLRDERSALFLPLAILALGFVERVGLLAWRGVSHAQGEAANVALSVARDGTIADVFARGSGLTAHLNPLLPLFAGSIYKLFGTQSTVSEWILALVSISVVLGAGAIFYHAAGLAGMARTPRLVALALFALLPVTPELETTAFRVWEGGLAALLGAIVLSLCIRSERDRDLSHRRMLILGATAGLLFFTNPALGLAAYAVIGLLLLRAVAPRKWLAHVAILAVTLFAVLTPWTIRNYEVFHRILPLRGNFGLELAIGNHPAALGTSDRQTFVDRLRTIHPLESQTAFDRMQAMGGEIPYANALGDEAKAWIRTHPGDFARLSVKHLVQYYFPPRWQWNIYSERVGKDVIFRQALLWGVAALGLLGAFAALFAWRERILYLATFALVPALPYIITQPVPRYRYIVLLPLLFLAANTAYRLYRKLVPGTAAAA